MDGSFDTCLSFTLEQEGGYVDDPADPGGATNMGITLATLRSWTRDPALGPAQVRAMPRAEAAAIYRAMYWNPLHGDALPAGVDLSVFDFGVNAGIRRSALMLQQALGLGGEDLDGCIGPVTLRAAAAMAPAGLVAALAQRQAGWYRGLAAFDRFGRGWLARTERRRQAALALLERGGGAPTLSV